MYKTQKINFLINILFFSVIAGIGYVSVRFLLIYLLPFLIGLLLTVAVQRPAAFLSGKFSVRKGHCALFLVVCLYLIIAAILFAIIYFAGIFVSQLISGNGGFIDGITIQLESITDSVNRLLSKIPPPIAELIPQTSGNLVNELTAYLSGLTKRAASAAPMFITTSVVTVVGSCYIAKDYDRFKDSINSILSVRVKKAIKETKQIFHEKIVRLFWGYGKLLCITFAELSIGLFLLKVPNALLISAAIALLDLLPVFGTGTVLVPWAIVSVISGNYYFAAGIAVLYVIILIIRNAVEPRMIGKQIGLHPLIALICVFIGLKLFGIIGMVLLPLTVMLIYNMFEKGVFGILFSQREENTTTKQ